MLQNDSPLVLDLAGSNDSPVDSRAEDASPKIQSPVQPTLGESGSDFLGITGSFLCLIHCLAPQLMAMGILGAAFGSFFAGEIWAVFFWITCLWAVFRSAKGSPYPVAVLALWISFGVFSLGNVLEIFFSAGKGLSYSGSVLLIIAHTWNFRLQQKWKNSLRKFCSHPAA